MEKNKLGFWPLFFMLAGTMVGPSICVYLGFAMAATGLSTWICVIIAVLLGLFLYYPMSFMSKYINLRGGTYSVVSSMGTKIMAGIFAYSAISVHFTIASMVIACAGYFSSVFTGLDSRLTAFVILTLIFLLNLFEIKTISRTQTLLTVILVVCLSSFFIVGTSKISQPIFDINAPEFLTGGKMGFFTAIGILCAMGQTCQYATAFTDIAQNPKKDISRIMLFVPLFLTVFYVLITWTAEGVLPLSEVAGVGNLTKQAKQVFGQTLGTVFVFAGPVLALLTSINGFFVSLPPSMMANARDGWFPKAFNNTNKFGAPWVARLFLYILSACIILTGFNVVQITQLTMLISAFGNYLLIYCYFKFPQRYRETIEKSEYDLNIKNYYFFCILAVICETYIFIYSLIRLDKALVGGSLLVGVGIIIVAFIRGRSTLVKLESAVENNE